MNKVKGKKKRRGGYIEREYVTYYLLFLFH